MELADDNIITFDELYRSYTVKALNRAGSVKGAAKLLGKSERTVLRWKKTYRIYRCPVTREYYFGQNIAVKPPT